LGANILQKKQLPLSPLKRPDQIQPKGQYNTKKNKKRAAKFAALIYHYLFIFQQVCTPKPKLQRESPQLFSLPSSQVLRLQELYQPR
jgi:hypothetical protein